MVTETSKTAMRVIKPAYPAASMVGDLREFNAAKLPVVFVDDFRFQQADLDRWAADHAPITSPDDPRLKRDAYLPPPE